MRETAAANGQFTPALLLAAVLHAALIFGVRVDLARQLPAGAGALEISLEAVPAEPPGETAVAGPRQPSGAVGATSLMAPADAGPSPLATPSPAAQSIDEDARWSVNDGSGGNATLGTRRRRQTRQRAAAGQEGSVADRSVSPSSTELTDLDRAKNPATGEAGVAAAAADTTPATDPMPIGGRSGKSSGSPVADRPSRRGEGADSDEPVRLTAASLGRQISEWSQEYTRMPQVQPVDPPRTAYVEKVGTHRPVASAYERAWQDKVERVGNMNYPEDARRKNLTGGLMLSVAVNADGSINAIQVRRSSGHDELDQAAVRIVRLAAPFAAFPAELKKDYDVLWITRTWRFFTDNHLATTP